MCRKIAVVELTAMVTLMAGIQSGMCGKKNTETLFGVSFLMESFGNIAIVSVFICDYTYIRSIMFCEKRERFVFRPERKEVLRC